MLFKASNRSEDYWISVSDLMAGLMILFLFIAISYMVKTQKENDMYIYIEQEYELAQNAIYDALILEFKDDLEEWNAVIDKENLSFIFLSPDVLFKSGESVLQQKYKDILGDFFPRYIVSLDKVFYQIDYPDPTTKTMITNNVKAKDNIAAIRIEGHANINAPKVYITKNQKFLYNMKLSSDRSQSVLTYVLALDLNDQKPWVRDNVRAVGFSSSKPVFTDDKYDFERSKRVEFRIVLDAQERLFELIQKKREGKLNEINYIGQNDFLKSQILDKHLKDIEDAKEELIEKQGLISEADRKLNELEKELISLQLELEAIKIKINDLTSENEILEFQKRDTRIMLSVLKDERDRIENEINDYEEAVKNLSNDKDYYEKLVDDLKRESIDLKEILLQLDNNYDNYLQDRNLSNNKIEEDIKYLYESERKITTNDESEYEQNASQDNTVFTAYEKLPEPLTKIVPEYPLIAVKAGIKGTVVVEAYIDQNGVVRKTRILKSVDPSLDNAARDAIRKTRFSPAMQGPNQVPLWLTIPIEFGL